MAEPSGRVLVSAAGDERLATAGTGDVLAGTIGALLAQGVEETIRARGAAAVPSREVGLAILQPLRELDEVAYLRFDSVYRDFESLDGFEREIAELRSRSQV